MTAGRPQVRWLAGNDAESALIDVYLNGLMTGAASALENYTQAGEGQSEHLAAALVKGIREDPLMIETIRGQIRETFLGTDSGPKSFTLPLDPGAES